jgi:hypothetical protein
VRNDADCVRIVEERLMKRMQPKKDVAIRVRSVRDTAIKLSVRKDVKQTTRRG